MGEKKEVAMCRIPVQTTYRYVGDETTPTLVSAVYKNIPADIIARMFIDAYGFDAIIKGECKTNVGQ